MAIKTIAELIDELNEASTQFPEGLDTPIAVAYQPTYPLRGYISAVTATGLDEDEGDEPVVWLAVNQDNDDPYASRDAWQ
jgi:hypothetical protein